MTRAEFADFVRATFNAMDMITPAEGSEAVIQAFVEYERAPLVEDSACCVPPSAATPDANANDRSSLSSGASLGRGLAPEDRRVWCSGCGARWTSPEGFLLAGVVHLCGDCWRKVQSAFSRPTAPAINRIVQRVAELPDRTSPDDWPEAMLVTSEELRGIISEELVQVVAAPEGEREEQDVSAILQSVLQMIGLPGFDKTWFDEHGDWDFGKLRAHGLDAKLAEIRAALKTQGDPEGERRPPTDDLSALAVNLRRLQQENDEQASLAYGNDLGEIGRRHEAVSVAFRMAAEEVERLAAALPRSPAPTGKETP